MRFQTRTPRTNIQWTDLASWLDGAIAIVRRRSSRHRYAAMRAHWAALTVETVRSASKPELLRFIDFIGRPAGAQQAWARPERGHRRNTRWELFNVEARNRVFKLERAEDRDKLEPGHNARLMTIDAET